MALEEIIEKVKKIASVEAERLDMKISERAMNTLTDDLKEHEGMISEGLVKKAAKEYNIYESTKKLIKEASSYAIAEERETIFAVDVKSAMKDICPTYWPFC